MNPKSTFETEDVEEKEITRERPGERHEKNPNKEMKEESGASGKSGILLGITLNPRKCIGEKVRRIPINVETK